MPRDRLPGGQQRARGALMDIHPDNLTEVPIDDHFTLHFVEKLLQSDTRVFEREIGADELVTIEVRIAGGTAGFLAMREHQWARLWRAIVHATPSFERQGIVPQRTGRFR